MNPLNHDLRNTKRDENFLETCPAEIVGEVQEILQRVKCLGRTVRHEFLLDAGKRMQILTEFLPREEAQQEKDVAEWSRNTISISQEAWVAKTPERFQDEVDYALLPNPAAFRTVEAWNCLYPGLTLVGPPNSGKTRAGYRAMLNAASLGKGFTFFSARRLVETFMRLYRDEGSMLHYLRSHCTGGVLFIDDVDKGEMNERTGSILFDIADVVYADNLPTVFTTNRDMEWWNTKVGTAFTNRLFGIGKDDGKMRQRVVHF